MEIPIEEYAARAPAHVSRIFDAADRNQDGLLDKVGFFLHDPSFEPTSWWETPITKSALLQNEMVGLLIALNPALRIDWVTAHHLVELVS